MPHQQDASVATFQEDQPTSLCKTALNQLRVVPKSLLPFENLRRHKRRSIDLRFLVPAEVKSSTAAASTWVQNATTGPN
jgi:hypothetical protein